MAALYQLEHGDIVRIHRVDRGSITIGRDPKNDIVVLDRTVSRVHCRLICQEHRYFVDDLGTRNGTRVSGQRVAIRAALSSGVSLELGSQVFIFANSSPIEAAARSPNSALQAKSDWVTVEPPRQVGHFQLRVWWRLAPYGFLFGWRICRG